MSGGVKGQCLKGHNGRSRLGNRSNGPDGMTAWMAWATLKMLLGALRGRCF
jgi:hypothetical protein